MTFMRTSGLSPSILRSSPRQFIGLLMLFLLLNVSSIFLIDGLKCYCDICPYTNFTCETDDDGLCYTTAELDHSNNVVYHYRCLHSDRFNPPNSPKPCNNSFHVGKGCSGRGCCNWTDFCNTRMKVDCVSDPNFTD